MTDRFAVVVAVGDELLRGHTLDSNTHWLAQRLYAVGFPLRRTHQVADVQEEIVSIVRAEIASGASAVFCCGGLGPTPDDRTLAALAAALGRPLKLDDTARQHIQDRIDWLHGIGRIPTNEMREANRRMAEVPEGAIILNNSMGMAPGLAFPISAADEEEGRHLFVLPGVPRELKTIFEEEIVGAYLSGGTAHFTEEVHFERAVEAEFWDLLTRVEREFPGLSVGSYPQPDRGHLIIRLAGPDALQVAAAATMVREAAPAEPYQEHPN
ncbi:MAG: competence/damage-inducible protein A [Candidatus Dormibacteria bacterium]